jgi:signal peptide peptidase SppA
MGLTQLVPIDNWCIDYAWALDAWTKLELADASMFGWGDEGADTEMKYQVVDGVAVLALDGPLTKDLYCGGMFGGVSTVLARRALQKASRDTSVRSILLRISSPGGQVSGTNELATEVARIASSDKRCVAYAEDICCSAAYWVASQANEVYANATATVGSIGTYMVMYDTSKRYEANGVKVHVIGSGDMKGAGEPGTKITDAMLEKWRANILDINAHFVNAVKVGRGLSPERAAELATGETWIGDKSVANKLVDGVKSFDDVLNDMRNGKFAVAPTGRRRAMANDQGNLLTRIRSVLRDAETDDDTTEVATAIPSGDRALLATLRAMGIGNVAQLRGLEAQAKLGDEYLAETRGYAQAQAIRLYGAQKGVQIAARLANAPFAEVKASALSWEAEADAKHDTNPDTSGRRTSASSVALNAEGPDNEPQASGKTRREELMAMTPIGQRVLRAERNGK